MPKRKKLRQDQCYLLLALGLFVLSLGCVLVSEGNIIEEYLFRFAHDLPGFMAPAWLLVTQFGSFFAALAAIILAWALHYRKLAAYLTLNTLLAYSLSVLVKELIARPRPLVIFDGVVVRDVAAFGFGFPSGHTAIATVLAFTIWPWAGKKFRWILVSWVLLVAFSRLYLGVHAPLDVVGGFAIGASTVFATRILVRDILKRDK